MTDLGRYAFDVALAYGLSAVLIGGLVGWTLIRARAVRRRLGERGE